MKSTKSKLFSQLISSINSLSKERTVAACVKHEQINRCPNPEIIEDPGGLVYINHKIINTEEIKTKLTTYFNQQWNRQWREHNECRQTKRFWPSVCLETSKYLLKLSKTKLNQIIQLITGHGFNNYHLSLLNEGRSSACHYCGADMEETWHLVMECDRLAEARAAKMTRDSSTAQTNILSLPRDLTRLPGLLPAVADVFAPPAQSNSSINRDGLIPPHDAARSD